MKRKILVLILAITGLQLNAMEPEPEDDFEDLTSSGEDQPYKAPWLIQQLRPGLARKLQLGHQVAQTANELDKHSGKIILGVGAVTIAAIGAAYINAQKQDAAKRETDLAEARRTVYLPVLERLKAGTADQNYINRTLIEYVLSASQNKYLDPITIKLLILNGADQNVIEEALKIAVIPANYDREVVEAILTTIPQSMRNAPIEAQLTRIFQMANPIIQVITCALESKQGQEPNENTFNFDTVDARYPGLLDPILAPDPHDEIETKQAKIIQITLLTRKYTPICEQLNLNKPDRRREIMNKVTNCLDYVNNKHGLRAIEPLEMIIPEAIRFQNNTSYDLTVQITYTNGSMSPVFTLQPGKHANLETLLNTHEFDMHRIKQINLTSIGTFKNSYFTILWADLLKTWEKTNRTHTQLRINLVMETVGLGTGFRVDWKVVPEPK